MERKRLERKMKSRMRERLKLRGESQLENKIGSLLIDRGN